MTRCLNPVFRDRGEILNCGKCLPCKIKRRTIWSLRMLHELTTSNGSCFVTLTYAERNIFRSPALITHAGTLVKHHLQVFFKRLRRRRVKDGLSGQIKYYACGEYGDQTLRPHYHIVFFGVSADYLNHYPRDLDGAKLIDHLWHHGERNEVSVVTEARVRYVAGYIDKKLFGERGERAYRDVEPPFQLSSNGIGKEFVSANYEQIIYDGALRYKKSMIPIPRTYRNYIAASLPSEMDGVSDRIRMSAKLAGIDFLLENFPEFGGRSYEQLTALEKRTFGYWLRDRSAAYLEDLKAGIRRRNDEKGDNYV